MDAIDMDPMDCNLSDSSSSPPPDAIHHHGSALKRTASDAGLKPNGLRPTKSVKRRAAKACQCCRARKVRCNVVEHGAPCTNCRLDEVECIVSESKRKKKWSTDESPSNSKGNMMKPPPDAPLSAYPPYAPLRRQSEHVPHALYQDLRKESSATLPASNAGLFNPSSLFDPRALGTQAHVPNSDFALLSQLASPDATPPPLMPAYMKPLPARFGKDEIMYLRNKGALSIPDTELRNELLKSYVDFVHPFMPLLDMHSFVAVIDGNGHGEQISLLLFQSVMFAATATVDMRHLKAAGYSNRRDARRDFFNKTRLLYDFDYEVDRISLIQALLLMTYWYETPDDQKDSHHWMGIAVSLSHTIGLHRNTDKTASMEPARKKLWRRIWWSTYMRDRLIALGMRRPTRIKDADFDVPMLSLEDFDLTVLPDGPSCIPADCSFMRDVEQQRQLAIMCIEKAKLCICVSNVLAVQYSVLHNNHGIISSEGNTRTTMMLVARRLEPDVDQVQTCDQELNEWKRGLAPEAEYVTPTWQDVDSGNENMALNRSLLHMVYYATLSALHRPQVLPSTGQAPRNTHTDVVDLSRKAVRLAAVEITTIANTLYNLDLVRYLPTTGITALLPAIIIHLLDIKAPGESTRRASLQGFCQCMQIMAKLRDIYAAADYSTAFLEAAIRKAEIILPQKIDEVKEPRNVITSTQGLLDAGKRLHLTGSGVDLGNLTPPPEDLIADTGSASQAHASSSSSSEGHLSDNDIARRLSSYLASTPPPSDQHSSHSDDVKPAFPAIDGESYGFADGAIVVGHDTFEPDFDSMVNLDAAGEIFSLEDGALGAMQGESSGFALDMDWMKGMGSDGYMGEFTGVGEDVESVGA